MKTTKAHDPAIIVRMGTIGRVTVRIRRVSGVAMVEAGGGFHYNNARFNQDIRSIYRPIRGLYGDTMAPALFVEGLRGVAGHRGPVVSER